MSTSQTKKEMTCGRGRAETTIFPAFSIIIRDTSKIKYELLCPKYYKDGLGKIAGIHGQSSRCRH